MYKGIGPILAGRYPVLWCLPHERWFLAHYLLGHPDLDVYIDIAAPPVWSGRTVKVVDLDLDVIVWNDGREVELVDEDEFELHRVQLGYPDDVVVGARASAERVLREATAGEPPFDADTAGRWFRALERLSLR